MIADPIILWCPSLRLGWWLQARQHHPFFHCSQQVMVAIRPEAATLQQLQQHQIYRILAENQSGTMHKFIIHLATLWNYVFLVHECHLLLLLSLLAGLVQWKSILEKTWRSWDRRFRQVIKQLVLAEWHGSSTSPRSGASLQVPSWCTSYCSARLPYHINAALRFWCLHTFLILVCKKKEQRMHADMNASSTGASWRRMFQSGGAFKSKDRLSP